MGSFKLKEISKKIQLDEADEEMRFIEENKLDWLYFEDNLYPERLKYCIDGPILYFQKGNIDLQKNKIINIVGARKITNYGKVFCEKLIEELAPINPIIISGFAYGVDITTHKAAIENGLQTVACLAHGLNQIYPKTHKRYVNNVMNNGGFISEFWSSDAFNKTNFLKEMTRGDLDTIALKCYMPTYKLASILLTMELKGIIRPLPGKLFELI